MHNFRGQHSPAKQKMKENQAPSATAYKQAGSTVKKQGSIELSHSKAKSPMHCAEIVFGNLTNLEMVSGRYSHNSSAYAYNDDEIDDISSQGAHTFKQKAFETA